jgi:hypothetical protein
MAKENKGRFKKGQVANPTGKGGPAPLPPEVREANKLTKAQILEVLNRMMVVREGDIDKLLADPNTPVFHKAVARLFQIALDEGCERKIDFVLNRLIGKVTDKVEVDNKRPVIIRYDSGESVYLGPERKEEE